ncbi:MAG: anti-sigma factor antagonist [Clostridia bacterium]|nr:anti-sigma factor antagonist [Clostridia bacterium]
MDIDFIEEDKLLVLKITEEIDHHTTDRMRRLADYEIQRYSPRKVVFDFSGTSFMDSAGIGLIIGRYKMASMIGAKVEIKNVKENIRRIFEMTGILKIIPIIGEEDSCEEVI